MDSERYSHNPLPKKTNHRAHRGFICVLKMIEKEAEKGAFTNESTETEMKI